MDDETLSVGQLAARIGAALTEAFPAQVWVRGEIQDLSRPEAVDHVYFTLVDTEPGQSASLPVVLFASNRAAVNSFVQRQGGVRMENGTEVRIRGEVQYYAPQGRLSLRMTWIDPAYTLGRLAEERDRLLRALAAEGLIERNGALSLPPAPLRVGLVTSRTSAAEGDFLHELASSGYGWAVVAADTRVQGAGAPRSLVAGLATVAERGVDVIALVRGGGARSELAAFDDEALARAIAIAPVPVVTGIGHEMDRSVADEVAHTAYKTPTACAAALVKRVRDFVAGAERAWASIAAGAGARLDAAMVALGHRSRRLGMATRGTLDSEAAAESAVRARLGRAAYGALDTQEVAVGRALVRVEVAGRAHTRGATAGLAGLRSRLATAAERRSAGALTAMDAADGRLRALDPERILARGWTVTRMAGRAVRSAAELASGDELVTTFADGEVTSRVESSPRLRDDGADQGAERDG